ncbi:sorting nexin-11 isoform X2 [Astyanax mexicanus]|uniref:sorting nexin-11 isoform X2 n=1 Tax=Astyanax mexicanus TaxID=7994 RepID=UPI000BBD6E5D|nr:sorting nexin-11 isoform X2 [Astyanax mexicanus]
MFPLVAQERDFPLNIFITRILGLLQFWQNQEPKEKKLCPVCWFSFGRMIKSQEDEFIAVRVQDPRVVNEGSWNSYVDFKIFLHTNSKAFTAKTSCVRRRYSEFVWLKRKLQKNAGLVPVPDLPGKSVFAFNNTDFIEKRRKGLQNFLDKVVHMTVCLSDSQLHLFLQTQLPVGHIEDCVQGHTPFSVTDAILTYASSNRGWAQEEEDGSVEPCPAPISYESMESPSPHVPTLQCEGASGEPTVDTTDLNTVELRVCEIVATEHNTANGDGPEQRIKEESCNNLVVEVHHYHGSLLGDTKEEVDLVVPEETTQTHDNTGDSSKEISLQVHSAADRSEPKHVVSNDTWVNNFLNHTQPQF